MARSPEGPRGDSPLSVEERDFYENLILLCLIHHKVVDDDPQEWTVAGLAKMKAEHEQSIAHALPSATRERNKDELIYATIIEEWVARAAILEWRGWTSGLLLPTPCLPQDRLAALEDMKEWLLSRPWPGRFDGLEEAFENFRAVANDVAMVIEYGLRPEGDLRCRRPIYKDKWVDNFDELAAQNDWIVDVIHDLVFEMTRAANYAMDAVRQALDPYFMIDFGVVHIERLGAGFYSEVSRPRYRGSDLDEFPPYMGLYRFVEDRSTRDVFFGEGFDGAAYREITPGIVGGSMWGVPE